MMQTIYGKCLFDIIGTDIFITPDDDSWPLHSNTLLFAKFISYGMLQKKKVVAYSNLVVSVEDAINFLHDTYSCQYYSNKLKQSIIL